MTTIGQRIRELRKEKDLKQEDLGKLVGLGKTTISMYENDNSLPPDDVKLKMIEIFNVSLDYLMGLSDDRNYTLNSSKLNVVKKSSPKVETIAAHLEDKDLDDEKVKKINEYIDFLFSRD